jgi:hypothetical protein
MSAFTENQLVVQPAIGLFVELGYGVGNARHQLPQDAFTGASA